MKLVASTIVHNERDRYLAPWLDHLLAFCDEVVVLDDYSTDGTLDWLKRVVNVTAHANDGPAFMEHEGHARQHLLELTMQAHPTHILAIDADEFIGDGQHLRRTLLADWSRSRLNRPPRAWRLQMQEVWHATPTRLYIRRDGHWRPHNPPLVYHPPRKLSGPWRIRDKALACGREPAVVNQFTVRHEQPVTDILHFGWTNEHERVQRYQRYIERDNGDFHQQKHLHSIMWPAGKVRLSQRQWPAGLSAIQAILLDRAASERHLQADRA